VAVVVIQKFVPDVDSPDYKPYFGNALSWGCGTAALLGIVSLLTLWSTVIGTRNLSSTKLLLLGDDPTETTPLICPQTKRK
jgi:hypothetical protein